MMIAQGLEKIFLSFYCFISIQMFHFVYFQNYLKSNLSHKLEPINL